MLAFGATLAAFFAYVVVQRFRHSVELEWMTGSILDHVERVTEGKPLYAAPSADWIPFLYPPLYYWLSALVARVTSIAVACRIVSIASTLASAALIARIAHSLGARRFWIGAALACFFGAYSYSGYWYDIERCDMLVVALLLFGTWLAVSRTSPTSTALAGFVVGLAFFAKQPAFFFLLFGALAFLALRAWRRAIAFAFGGILGIGPLFLYLHQSTGGWFDYYCVAVPGAHGLLLKLITVFFVTDLSNAFVLTAATFAFVIAIARDVVRAWRTGGAIEPPPPHVIFAFMLAAAFVASASSRMHFGGWPNVLVYFSSFACVAVALVGTRFEDAVKDDGARRVTEAILATGVLLQLVHFAYDPGDVSPDSGDVSAREAFEARVRRLEARGPVLLTPRGHVTSPRHFHAAALQDVLRAGGAIPEDLARGLRDRTYAAYVVDEMNELSLDFLLGHMSDLFALVTANYYVAERFDDRDRPPLVGWVGHPKWLLRPRQIPLSTTNIEALARRQRIEMGIAEMRMRIAQSGAPNRDDESEIETLAASLDDERASTTTQAH